MYIYISRCVRTYYTILYCTIQLLMAQAKCLSHTSYTDADYMQNDTQQWKLDRDTDSSHLQKIDNPKHQMHLLWWPQPMNNCTCAQACQQCRCDPCLLLASQVSHPTAGNTLRDKDQEWKCIGECKYPQLLSMQMYWTSWWTRTCWTHYNMLPVFYNLMNMYITTALVHTHL